MTATLTITGSSGFGSDLVKGDVANIVLAGDEATTPRYTPARTDLDALAPAGEHAFDTGPVQDEITYRIKARYVDPDTGLSTYAVFPSFCPNTDYEYQVNGWVVPAPLTGLYLVRDSDDSFIISND